MKENKVISQEGKELKPRVKLHPGYVLSEEIEARGLKKAAFALKIGISPTQLSELLHGKRHVSAALALKLEELLDIDAEFWLRIQMQYDLAEAREKKALAV